MHELNDRPSRGDGQQSNERDTDGEASRLSRVLKAVNSIATMPDNELAAEIFDKYFVQICTEDSKLAALVLQQMAASESTWLNDAAADSIIVLYDANRDAGESVWISLVGNPATHNIATEMLELTVSDGMPKDQDEIERLMRIVNAVTEYKRSIES